MNVYLYQIQYDDKTAANATSGFLTYDCRANPEFLKREIAHLLRFYQDIVQHAKHDDYFALLSPKFSYKTGVMAQEVKEFIQNHSNQDVYLFNPYPMHAYAFQNVWQQAKVHHPEILSLVDRLFNTVGMDFQTAATHRHHLHQVVYCNYWVAKKSFFDQYIPFLVTLDQATENMPAEQREEYFAMTNYKTQACCYPFIFERLLTTYLWMHPKVKSQAYEFSEPFKGYNRLNRIERKFYFGQSRTIFDDWEREQKTGSETILSELQLLSNLLYPQVKYKWMRSIAKTINVFRLDRIVSQRLG